MFAIDEMAYKSPLRTWPPVGKLLLVLALLLGSLLSPTPVVPLIVLAIGLVLLNRSCGLRLPSIMAIACIETMFTPPLLHAAPSVQSMKSIAQSHTLHHRGDCKDHHVPHTAGQDPSHQETGGRD